MAKKKSYEFREKEYRRNSDGLKQRRLKDESRWKFNPNDSYSDGFLDDMTIFEDEDYYDFDKERR